MSHQGRNDDRRQGRVRSVPFTYFVINVFSKFTGVPRRDDGLRPAISVLWELMCGFVTSIFVLFTIYS